MADKNFPEMIDALGEKPNGERVLIGKVPMPPEMKMKDIIRNYIGMDFADEDSAESYALYAMQDFYDWHQKQTAALAELKDADTLQEPTIGEVLGKSGALSLASLLFGQKKAQQASEKKVSKPAADDVINRVAVELRDISEDPMWADHVEISKAKMVEWANALEGSEAHLYEDIYEQCCNLIEPFVDKGKLPGSVVESLELLLEANVQPLHTTQEQVQESAVGEHVLLAADWVPDWKHAANEWADVACSALQWLRNLRDGISDAETAIANTLDGIEHARDIDRQVIAVTPQEPAQAEAQAVFLWRLKGSKGGWYELNSDESPEEYTSTDSFETRTLYTRPAGFLAGLEAVGPVRSAALDFIACATDYRNADELTADMETKFDRARFALQQVINAIKVEVAK